MILVLILSLLYCASGEEANDVSRVRTFELFTLLHFVDEECRCVVNGVDLFRDQRVPGSNPCSAHFGARKTW